MLGVLGFARGISDSYVLRPQLTPLVVAALVVMAAARFVSWGAVQFYVQGAAGIAALWPLAYKMWKHSEAENGGKAATDAGDLMAPLRPER